VSLAQGLNNVLPKSGAQSVMDLKRIREREGGGWGGGCWRRLENRMVSVLWVFNRRFPYSEVFE